MQHQNVVVVICQNIANARWSPPILAITSDQSIVCHDFLEVPAGHIEFASLIEGGSYVKTLSAKSFDSFAGAVGDPQMIIMRASSLKLWSCGKSSRQRGAEMAMPDRSRWLASQYLLRANH